MTVLPAAIAARRRDATAPRTGHAPARARLLLAVNPCASRRAGGDRTRVLGLLAPAFAVTVAETEARGHATALCREAVEDGYDLVAVLGGDGTVSEAADGLAGSATALTCLPAGCTNVFARALGIPRSVTAAAERLVARAPLLVPQPVDLGTVNGRHFLFSSGVGLPASMVGAVESGPPRKVRLGQLPFVAAAASEIAGRYLRDPPRMRVEAGGRAIEGITVVVQNSEVLTYLGPRRLSVCEAAGLSTGTISLAVLLGGAGARDLPGLVPRVLSGRPAAVVSHPKVQGFAGVGTARVTALGGVALPVEADGEFLGEHSDVLFGTAPGALRVVA